VSPALTVALFALLSAGPTTGVAISKRSGVNRNLATARAELVRSQLGEGVAPVDDLTSCNAKRPCLVKAARERGWTALIAIETATVLDEGIIDVSLLSIDDDGKELAHVSEQAAEPKLAAALQRALPPLIAELKKLTAAPVSTPPPTTTLKTPVVEPVATVVEPELRPIDPPPPLPPVVVAEPAPERPAARWVPLGISLLVLAGGATSYGLSVRQADLLRSGTLRTDTEITAAVANGKLLQTLGVSGLIAGGALTAGSLVLALLWPEAKVTPAVTLAPGGGVFGVTGVWP